MNRLAARLGTFVAIIILALTVTAVPASASDGVLIESVNLVKCASPTSSADNASITLIACSNVPIQLWDFVLDSTITGVNVYSVHNEGTGKCFAVNTLTNNSPVVQLTCARTNGQLWQYVLYSANKYYIVNRAAGLCLSRQGLVNLAISTCVTGAQTQLWYLF